MKQAFQSIAYLSTIFIVAAAGLAGCDSTGSQRSKAATTTMQSMENSINLVALQLDATGASLDELMRPGQSDVKKAFNSYTDNISKIEKMEKDFAKHADEMKARGKDYFEEWQKEGDKYKNQQIQELSDQRRSDLGEIYGRIAENSVGVREAFAKYVSDSKEIQNYLSNDLTPKGIEAIATLSKRVVDNGENLRNAIKNVQSAIVRAREEMAQSGR